MQLTRMSARGWIAFSLFIATLGLLLSGFQFWLAVRLYRSFAPNDANYVTHAWDKDPSAWFIILFGLIVLAQLFIFRETKRERQSGSNHAMERTADRPAVHILR